jgi:Fic family protein
MISYTPQDFAPLAGNQQRMAQKKARLDQHRPLPKRILDKLRDTMAVEWTYHSNRIEGNTLSLQETHLVIREGLTVKGKTLPEHFEAYNHDKAIELIYEMAQKKTGLNTRTVLDIHALVLRSIEEVYAGRFRNAGVRISGANFIPPNARKVPDLMEELVEWWNQEAPERPLLESITVFHQRFVWIHPFFDGNGRTIRLLTNLFLIRAGYPPAIILQQDRQKYYQALNAANRGRLTPLGLLLAQAMERTLNIYLNALPGYDGDDYLPINQLVEEAQLPYGTEYISLLARRGHIDAYKEGRNWYTSRQAVEDYARRKGKAQAGTPKRKKHQA